MSTFICSKCGCIDNSAMDNNYWARKRRTAPPLCTVCCGNKWHDKFEKQHWSKIGTKTELIVEAKKDQGNYENAVEYFKTEA